MQGMARGHLNSVFQAIVLNRIAHIFPACGPFLNIALSEGIHGLLKRSYRYGNVDNRAFCAWGDEADCLINEPGESFPSNSNRIRS